MFPVIVFALISVALIVYGIQQVRTPLDVLWPRYEQSLLARGLAPQRNAVWEQSTRRIGWMMIVAGLFFLITIASRWISSHPQMSGVVINGRELTQAEYRNCTDCVTVTEVR